MDSPKVTVLMSVYNAGSFFAPAVESILNQSFADFEFLIIDDGSSEPVTPLLDQYRDERITVIRQQNMGLTRSLNRGLSLAQAAYVARMDADDLSLSHRLASQVDAMDSDERLDLVGCYFDVMDAQGNMVERKEPFTDPIYRLWRLQFHNNYGHGSVMIRKASVVRAGMYDEKLRYAQDFDLWCRLSKKNNTRMIPDVLYRYRMVRDSAQASVKNYDAQLSGAIQISNRSLILCDPRLTETDCAEARALYWEFQLDGIALAGLEKIPAIFDGFCCRYSITGGERSILAQTVLQNAVGAIARSNRIEESNRALMAERFRVLFAGGQPRSRIGANS